MRIIRACNMGALRTRLAVALLLVLALFWGAWITALNLFTTQKETGLVDAKLSRAGVMALTSIPRGIVDTEAALVFQPRRATTLYDDQVSVQLWDVQRRRLLMRSPGAPMQPFVGDFTEGFSDASVAGEAWRVYTLSDVTQTVQVQIGKPQDSIDDEISTRVFRGLSGAVIMFLCLAAVVSFVVWATFRPMRKLGATLQARDLLDFEPLTLTRVPTELHPFIKAVNAMQARQAEALARERRFIADAAHELRTPLAALTTQAELASRTTDAEARAVALTGVLTGTRRATRLAEQLLDDAQLDAQESLRFEQVDLASLVSLEVREFEERAKRKQQSVKLHAKPTPVSANIDALGILISNLLDNALRHAPPGASVEIDCDLGTSGEVELSVRDDGPGIAPAEAHRVFERFYRSSRTTESGSGIGLSLVARIARMHRARIVCGTGIDGRGWGVTVVFPRQAGTLK